MLRIDALDEADFASGSDSSVVGASRDVGSFPSCDYFLSHNELAGFTRSVNDIGVAGSSCVRSEPSDGGIAPEVPRDGLGHRMTSGKYWESSHVILPSTL